MANCWGNLISYLSLLYLWLWCALEVKGQSGFNDQGNQLPNEINILAVVLTAVIFVIIAVVIITATFILLSCFLKYLNKCSTEILGRRSSMRRHGGVSGGGGACRHGDEPVYDAVIVLTLGESKRASER